MYANLSAGCIEQFYYKRRGGQRFLEIGRIFFIFKILPIEFVL